MLAQAPPSPALSALSRPSVSLSRPALIKALVLLVFFWLIAGYTRISGSNDADSTSSIPFMGGQNAADANSPVADAAGSKPAAAEAPAPDRKVKQHTDRAAVIIENRPLENLIPVILHFHSVLGPEWPVIFYTTPSTAANFSTSAPFTRAVEEGGIVVRYLPDTATFTDHHAVSLFLAEPWIWEDLAPFKKILMFQDDSIICSASSARVDDFIEYDLIGAPIAASYGKGYNGGLSIRNRELVLDLFTMFSYKNDSETPGAPANLKFEDQWLYTRMQQLPAKADGTPAANLPSVEVAGSFAVETVWEEKPLGFHQPVRWQKKNMAKIMKYCPEVGMIGGAAFFSARDSS